MENFVVGTSFLLRPTQSLSIQTELSNRIVSSDRRISRASDLHGAATTNYWAMKTDLNMRLSFGSFGVGFEYVEPGYQSPGAYYTVNDFINYTIKLATALLNGRINHDPPT